MEFLNRNLRNHWDFLKKGWLILLWIIVGNVIINPIYETNAKIIALIAGIAISGSAFIFYELKNAQEVDENYNPVITEDKLSPFIRAEIQEIIRIYREPAVMHQDAGECTNKLKKYQDKSIHIKRAYNIKCSGNIDWYVNFMTCLYRAVEVKED